MVQETSAAVRGRGYNDDPRNSLGHLLRDTSRLVQRELAARLERHRLSLPQYYVLRELWSEEGLSQRELAARVGVLDPAMVATIDALAEAGLVVRERSSSDRRKTNVLLTPAGRRARDELTHHAAETIESALAGIDDATVACVRVALQRMKANLGGESATT